jgi:tRNA A37 methylthiotransferase MiaB
MGLNPGAVDEELVALFKEAGFKDVDLGVESGSDTTLKSLGKNFRKEDILQAGKLLQDKKIPVTWYLLVGAPGETYATLQETFDTINKAAAEWDLINVGIGIRVYKGAQIAIEMERQNPSCSYDNFLRPVHYEPESISLEQVKVFTKKVALQHPNYFMYDEDEDTPAFLLMIASSALRIFARRQPIWRLHILLKKIQNFVGIGFLKRTAYNLKHREII